MNMNPYPLGRWTTANAVKSQSAMTPASHLLKAPLRELFWGIPESRLLDEAKARIDSLLATALSGGPGQPPLALA